MVTNVLLDAELTLQPDDFRALVEILPDPMARLNRRFQFVYVNPAAQQLIRLPLDQILGRTSQEVGIPPEVAAEWHRVIGRVFEEGVPHRLEFEVPSPDGVRCFESRLTPEWGADGQVKTVLAIARDVTRMRHTEAMLRAHLRRLEVTHRIYQLILTSHTPEHIGAAVLPELNRLVPCCWAAICSLDEDVQAIRVISTWRSDAQADLPFETSFMYPISSLVGALKAAADEAALMQVLGRTEFVSSMRRHGLTMLVPLRAAGELIGLLALALHAPAELPSETHLVFREIATYLALALKNAFLIKSVREHREQLHRLAARMSETQETERRRIAIELHDRVGQNLTALGITLNVVRSVLSTQQAGVINAKLDAAMSLLEETVEHVRDLMSDLRPPVLDDYGLLAALRWFCQLFTERTGVQTQVEGAEPTPRLEQMVEINLFRIAQEALTNAAKHARATLVTVCLNEKEHLVQLSICDDGVGFDVSAYRAGKHHTSLGLAAMHERAAAVGGRLHVESHIGAGTRVVVEISR
ncbi:MAG: PAS domain-containing protein, partial [Anaerolineae bacterium]|nr:PAS domain-containing protein [Thermoflexales bacterium]MDW8408940.1 PAS domain-containing protein [Anaerolineae bacterium]